VARERAPGDRRCINLALTDDGVAVAMRCKRRVIARWNDWLVDWREEDVEMLIALLSRLRGTLEGAA
jgi:DNA-binding MarR family transcriptional regulator